MHRLKPKTPVTASASLFTSQPTKHTFAVERTAFAPMQQSSTIHNSTANEPSKAQPTGSSAQAGDQSGERYFMPRRKSFSEKFAGILNARETQYDSLATATTTTTAGSDLNRRTNLTGLMGIITESDARIPVKSRPASHAVYAHRNRWEPMQQSSMAGNSTASAQSTSDSAQDSDLSPGTAGTRPEELCSRFLGTTFSHRFANTRTARQCQSTSRATATTTAGSDLTRKTGLNGPVKITIELIEKLKAAAEGSGIRFEKNGIVAEGPKISYPLLENWTLVFKGPSSKFGIFRDQHKTEFALKFLYLACLFVYDNGKLILEFGITPGVGWGLIGIHHNKERGCGLSINMKSVTVNMKLRISPDSSEHEPSTTHSDKALQKSAKSGHYSSEMSTNP